MKRVCKAGRPVHPIKFCACHAKQAADGQDNETLSQEKGEPHQAGQEWDRFLALSSDILVIVKFDGYFKRLSPACERILGFSQEELLTKPFLEFVHPDDRAATIAVVQQLAKGKRVDGFENRYRCKDSSYKWLSWSGVAAVDEQLIYCTARDISNQKQMERTLQESEARFRAFMQNTPTAAWITDADGRVIYLNENYYHIVQLVDADPIGKTLFDLFPTEVAQPWMSNIRHVVDTQQTIKTIEMGPKTDGTMGTFLVYKFPMSNYEGVCLVGGVAVDISELKRTEAALRESEERFRQIAENIPEVFWVADVDFTQLFYVSPAYEEIWGRTCQSLYEQPRSFVEAVHPDDKSQVLSVLEQHIHTGFSHEYRVVQPNGSLRWIWERAFTINDSAGNPYRVVGISQDVTERRRAEEALSLADFSFERSAIAATWIGSDARILRVNESACRMLEYSREELHSKYVYEIDPNVPQEIWSSHWKELQQQKTMTFTSQVRRKDGNLVPVELTLNYLEFNGKEYNFAFARDISKQLQAEADLLYQREQEQLVVSITQQIRQSLNLEEVLDKTVTAVRGFLKSDRVLIYRLDAEMGGYIIAESVGAGWMTTSGRVINDCYFTDTYAQLYQQGRVHAVDDIYTAGLTPCHVDLLAKFEVRANLAVPIAHEDRLWGLLVVQQCGAPRHWQPLEIDLLKQLATQVAIAIQQSEIYQQAQIEITQRQQAEAALRQQAEREHLLAATAQRIRQCLDLNHVLDTTVTEVRHLLKADRVLLYWINPEGLGRVITESVASGYTAILDQPLPPEIFPKDYHELYRRGRIRKIIDIETDELSPCLAETLRQFEVRSKLVVPILQGEDLWGLLIAHQCRGPRIWDANETDLLQQLSTHVAIALQQSELYQQAQTEIAQRQLAEAALRQQSNHERLIAAITSRIRQSLNLDEVLSVTVHEVRSVLEADRVLIFQLNIDGSGIIVKEAVVPEYPVTKEMRWLDECFPIECYEFYRQGKARIVPDVAMDDWGACLAPFMQSVGVKSKVVAPIVQVAEAASESRVWGLLIAHACAEQRQWQPIEVELLEHLSGKLAIAIQQAELHQQVQQLNINLESQVQKRTTELQQALKLEALLKRITDKVRDSLDETQILQTAVQELAIGLNVLCCDIAFYNIEDQSSTIVCEYITSEVSSVDSSTFSFSNLPELYDQLLQGQYAQFSTLSTACFWRRGATPHLTVLSCPMMDEQGVVFGDLWLFKPCEDYFNEQEVRLVEQVANQCIIALRQSRLYQAAQAQVTELERLNHLKDDFLSTVSHELRTPMSNIKMAIQMLELIGAQASPANSTLDRSDQYFNILRSECEREISLINDLLDLTRLEADIEPLNLLTIDPKIWIPSVLEPFEHRVCNQQQQLQVFIPATLPPITTDLSYLERILSELLNNACKYTPAGEMIWVSVKTVPKEQGNQEPTSSLFLITVSNSGVEIPDSELEHIFDKFYRVPNNDPWKHGGTGLGLALVKRLVERLSGKVEASSSQLQTTFTIQLPLMS